MPTSEQIEAAARAMAKRKCEHNARIGNETLSDDAMERAVGYAWPNWVDDARAALTAAEEVRWQVSVKDAELLDHVQFLCDAPNCRPYGAPTGETLTQADLRSLVSLARRGAGQAVPDETAIRADEREQCAAWHDKQASGFKEAYETVQGSVRDYAWSQYLWHDGAAKAIRAAAPKLEGKL